MLTNSVPKVVINVREVPVSFARLEFSQWSLVKLSNIKFRENPLNGSRVVPCGRTDGRDEANSRFWQHCESA